MKYWKTEKNPNLERNTVSIMSEAENNHVSPTEINLHQKSRLLEIAFSDGFRFNYPCEYVRVFSTAAEVKVMEKPVHGKQMVNISMLDPQGTYALKITFANEIAMISKLKPASCRSTAMPSIKPLAGSGVIP